jgi:gas vesicle protein
MAHNERNGGEAMTYIAGLILGAIISVPIAAWLSPRSGEQTRREIRQRGYIIRRKATQAVQQVGHLPGQAAQQVGQQIEQVGEKVGLRKGDSIEEALEEGRMIAAQRRSELGR